MSEFKFLDVDPRSMGHPKGRRHDPLIAEFAAALRANPNQWAEYPQSTANDRAAGAAAYRINKGADCPKPLRGGQFQAVSRGGIVYVRFAGNPA